MDKNLNIADLVKAEIKEHLHVKVTTDYGGHVEVELLYDDDVIDSACDWVVTDSNPLDA